MDAWERMFEDEREALDFLLQEEFTEDIMEKERTEQLLEMTLEHCDSASFSQKASFLQAAMLAEIALQLQQQNEHLEFIARAVDNSETFERIASWLHAIADKEAK